MLAPITVKLADPVAARLFFNIVLACIWLNDTVSVKLAVFIPIVKPTILDPGWPRPDLHCTNVSDFHSLLSQELPTTSPESEYRAKPKFSPDIVISIDPVTAAFCLKTVLAVPRSNDADSVVLECRSPTVRAILFVAKIPCPTLHTIAVSDCHNIPSDSVLPTHPDGEAPLAPIRMPMNVMLTDPVDALFAVSKLLATKESTETISVELPDITPSVSASLSECASPWLSLQSVDVSDIHALASLTVPPARSDMVGQAGMKLVPTSTRLEDPVDAELLRMVKLRYDESQLQISVFVPNLSPAVTKLRRVLIHALDKCERIAETDIHSVASAEVSPNFSTKVICQPKPEPTAESQAPSTQNEFWTGCDGNCASGGKWLLRLGMLNENTSVRLPEETTAVTKTLLELLSPCAGLTAKEVSENHLLDIAQLGAMPPFAV
jgi:hypothetical protein